MKESFFRRRVAGPVLALLRQGITPEKIAMSMALGTVLGVFPVIGTTTILCAAAAVLFRLNLPAIQVVNYLVYPLQILFLIPFYRLGSALFGSKPFPLDAGRLAAMFREDFWGSMSALRDSTLHAVGAWGVTGPAAALALYLVIAAILRRLPAGKRR